MSRKRVEVSERCPEGTRYIVESRGAFEGGIWVQRYLIYPDGRRVDLGIRAVVLDEATKSDPSPAPSQSRSVIGCEGA